MINIDPKDPTVTAAAAGPLCEDNVEAEEVHHLAERIFDQTRSALAYGDLDRSCAARGACSHGVFDKKSEPGAPLACDRQNATS
jgi:hypothetical protein